MQEVLRNWFSEAWEWQVEFLRLKKSIVVQNQIAYESNK